jgi:hypothetical protein
MAHGITGNYHHSVVASRVTMLAHLLFLTTAVLMLVWLLHYRGGINIQSEDPDKVFNVYMCNETCALIVRFSVSFFLKSSINFLMLI